MTKITKYEAIALQQILSYCEEIGMAVTQFGCDVDTFTTNKIYRNAVLYCIMQIGELIDELSEEFKAEHGAIPWRNLKNLRSAELYRSKMMEDEHLWQIIREEIPVLADTCRKVTAG